MIGGLVAVHAHPDDESLSTGALLASWTRAGAPASVVTCTRGERGDVIGTALAHLEGDGPALAEHRERELVVALAALGVHDHVYLDEVPGSAPGRFEDSGMAWVGEQQAGIADEVPAHAFVGVRIEDAARRLAQILSDRKPSVVATYEPGGGYGHPDHVRAHEITRRALELLPDPPVLLWAAQGASALRAAYRSLPPVAGLVAPDAAGPLPSVAVDDGLLDVAVDMGPVRDAVLDALRAHATQVQAVRPIDDDAALVGCYALSNGVLAPVLPVESYQSPDGRSRLGDVAWPAHVRPIA